MQENTGNDMQQQENTAMATIDLRQSIEHLKSEQTWLEKERHSLVLFKSAALRIVLVGMHEGAELNTHSSVGAITVQVLKGNMKFTAEESTVDMTEGSLVSLAARVPHSVIATEETFFLLHVILKA